MTEAAFPELPQKEAAIQFFSEDIDFEYPTPQIAQAWIEKVIELENCQLASVLNYIFCSDQYLHNLNIEYLNHDTLTDIITFPYSQPPLISGDIFISISRVRANAQQYQVPFQTELHRVMIHGILHLCVYLDKSTEEQQKMRSKENSSLELLSNYF